MNAVTKSPLELLVQELEVPRSSYETAAERYEDLGTWLHDPAKAQCAAFAPQVSPQGSFRLGTAIKPLGGEPYDLDLVCTLTQGVSPLTHSQMSLKNMLGADLEEYRKERRIQKPLEPKNRCWRLEYQDALAFHMDAMPAVPHTSQERRVLMERMVTAGLYAPDADALARLALAITDRRLPNYPIIDPRWPVSNPEGFARWFELRMKQSRNAISRRVLMEAVASIEELPTYRWKTPLQRVVQVLKRHRDIMFKDNPYGKPISVIITTLAARQYSGEEDLETALGEIVRGMAMAVNPSRPRVPNPVNPAEDFADKWATPEGKKLRLEENFFLWVEQAQIDFELVARASGRRLVEQASEKFGVDLSRAGVPTDRPSHSPRIQGLAAAPPSPWLG
ncbi:MAG: nucleotidyltransferase [Burkholderiales bacterium]|nr:nucleotidyltransferase [Burkholderiales bacterium]